MNLKLIVVFFSGLASGAIITIAFLASNEQPQWQDAQNLPRSAAEKQAAVTAQAQPAAIAPTAKLQAVDEAVSLPAASDRTRKQHDPTTVADKIVTLQTAQRRSVPEITAPPIAIPEPMRRLLEEQPDRNRGMTIPEAHRAVAAEQKNPDWAYAVESAIRQFFATHENAINFDIWLIECRESLCEIQGAGYVPEARQQLKIMKRQLKELPIMAQFIASWSASHDENGVLYFAQIYQRQAN